MTTKSEELRAQKLLRDELARLAMLLGECSTILEDAPYERALERLTRQALDAGDDTEIEAALSALKDDRPNAYDQLLSFAEEAAQTIVTDDGVSLLVGVPLLTWSRYRNFCGTIPETHLARVAEAYRRLFTLNTEDVKVHVGNALIAPEHIPDSLCKVRALLTRLAAPVEDPEYPVVDVHDLIDRPAAADFADSRYLLLSVSASSREHLFRPADESSIDRARAAMQFCIEAHDALSLAMIGAVFEVQPPAAYFWAWRQTDNAMRVWSLKSLVDFVECMGYPPGEVIASAAFFVPTSSDNPETSAELRIGLTPRRSPDKVASGVAWPVNPDEMDAVRELATSILQTKGVTNIVFHEQDFPLEWCEDCGSPLYASAQGLVVHIELPENQSSGSFAPTLN